MVHSARIWPSTRTLPPEEMCILKSVIFHGMIVTGESVTVLGTVFNILTKAALQRRPVFVARLLMVALPSEEKRRRSDRAATSEDVTKGPPFWPVPLRYSFMPTGSRTFGVLSKGTPPRVLSGVSLLAGTMASSNAA